MRKNFVHKSGCVGYHASILSNSISNISLPSLTPRHCQCLFHQGSSEALHQPDILPRTKLKPMHAKNILPDMYEIQKVVRKDQRCFDKMHSNPSCRMSAWSAIKLCVSAGVPACANLRKFALLGSTEDGQEKAGLLVRDKESSGFRWQSEY